MKDFLKYTLATVTGLMLTSILFTVLSIISIAGMVASEGMTAPIKDNSILRINLNGTLTERGQENPFAELMGENTPLSLEESLIALKKAADNKNIKGIFLEGGSLGASPAQIQELREGLLEFKKSGKWIVAYADQYSKGAYYLCSLADSVYLNPVGGLDWSGMSSQIIFFKGLMEKVGVKMQVFKVGTYKSAVEPYICTEMSPANREQMESFLGSVWGKMVADVAESRHMTAEQLNALADTLTPLTDLQVAVENGLIDKLCYRDEVRQILKNMAEVDEDESLTFTSISSVAKAETLSDKHDDKIAVYYAVGEIVGDGPTNNFSDEPVITAATVTKDLDKLAKDKDVKAVVIRVNSPGGSAYASEQIWRSVQLLKEQKPVIISMGGYAASGGYYISCGANKILAEETTLTGSIGIFGMIPDPSELLKEKLGLNFDLVKTNKFADLGAMGRPFNPEESELFQNYINKGYDLFTGRVAMGRGLTQDSVKVIAEGRVWTGEQALRIGLVDQLGNLDAAIEEAAKAAGIENYGIQRASGSKSWIERLMDKGSSDFMEGQVRKTLGEYYAPVQFVRTIGQRDPVQTRLPFVPIFK